MELTPIGEWLIVGGFCFILLLWAVAIATALHNDKLDDNVGTKTL